MRVSIVGPPVAQACASDQVAALCQAGSEVTAFSPQATLLDHVPFSPQATLLVQANWEYVIVSPLARVLPQKIVRPQLMVSPWITFEPLKGPFSQWVPKGAVALIL